MSAVDFSAFVHDLADAAGRASLPFFRTAIGAADKNAGGAFDPVTEADKAAEAAMRRLIAAQFPAHGIVGEEFGAQAGEADYVWTLDPIDGTRAFLCGLPLWGTLIGLGKRGAPVYGMMSQPFTRERFYGDGARADWRGPDAQGKIVERKLVARACASLSEATLMTTSPHLFEGEAAASFARVAERCRLVRYGADCYAYCMLAAGHVDLVIETGLKSYDIAPLIPIVEGAGGIVTSWDGGSAAQGGAVIAAGDARLHDIALRALSA